MGDAWLDAGIVPLSTLGWAEPGSTSRAGTRPAPPLGSRTPISPTTRYWEQWFPADWISEMREQIRLWFYSISFMSVTLVGRSPYRRVLTYEKLLDETGREMHRSWGNAIEVNEAFDRMGADVMRWQYCSQPPSQNLLFGYGPAHEIQRRLLTLWNSCKFLVDYANIEEAWEPTWDGPRGRARRRARAARPLARLAHERARRRSDLRLRELADGRTSCGPSRSFVDDVSNWYIRRSRRRFWEGDAIASAHALVRPRPGPPRGRSAHAVPHRPPLALLDRSVRRTRPESIHLAGWPEAAEPDSALLAEIGELRRVVELGRQARSTSNVKLRQPLRSLVVEGAPLAASHAAEIADELRVLDVSFGNVDASELRVKPNLPVLGPKLGRELGAVRAALEAGEFEELPGGGFRAAGHELTPDEVLVERHGKEGWAVAASDGVTVALDLDLDEGLVLRGRVYDLVHTVNTMRKEAGLELTDRIRLTLPAADVDLLEHREWIARETLAVSVEADGTELSFERVEG